MISSLLYFNLRTLPDILVAVLIIARLQKAPTSYCHRAAKRVLRYLKGTVKNGNLFGSSVVELVIFVHAEYASDTRDRNSMIGFVVKLGDADVSWGRKRQALVAFYL